MSPTTVATPLLKDSRIPSISPLRLKATPSPQFLLQLASMRPASTASSYRMNLNSPRFILVLPERDSQLDPNSPPLWCPWDLFLHPLPRDPQRKQPLPVAHLGLSRRGIL